MPKIKLQITEITSKHSTPTELSYGTLQTKFGKCLLGAENDSLYFIHFFEAPNTTDQETLSLRSIIKTMPWCRLHHDQAAVEPFRCIFEDEPTIEPLVKVTLVGTDFQRAVWKELLNIESGTTVSYEAVAQGLGRSSAVRAVASAIAKNNLAYVIPCHRVISKSGGINKYRWGVGIKVKMLEEEGALK